MENKDTVPAGFVESKASPQEKYYGQTLAFIIVRLWLSTRMIAVGLNKFSAQRRIVTEDFSTGDMSVSVVREYAFSNYVGVPAKEFSALMGDPLLPAWLLTAFYYALGPMLLIFGTMLLVGFGTRISLIGIGLIIAAITFGLSLVSTVSVEALGVHIALIAVALYLARYNKFCISKKF